MKIISTKSSLIEWSGHLSYVIFIAGCNMQCPFCYVPHLINEQLYNNIKPIEQEKILQDLSERKGFVDAVCITGGEPTTHPELTNFLQKIKQQTNLPIRLETNGTNPELIQQLIENKLIDSLALDIKNSKEKYSVTAGININLENIEKTLLLIKNSNLDHEIRTTLVPGLHELADIQNIVNWLKEKQISKLVLQQFRTDLPNQQTLNPAFLEKGNYSQKEMENIKQHINISDFKIELRV
jgi:pyruvate formate lyase activating enzyme